MRHIRSNRVQFMPEWSEFVTFDKRSIAVGCMQHRPGLRLVN